MVYKIFLLFKSIAKIAFNIEFVLVLILFLLFPVKINKILASTKQNKTTPINIVTSETLLKKDISPANL